MDDEPAFAESLVPLIHYGWSDLRALRDGRWKYILAPRPELYDLERDPGERQNLADREPARARALRAGLEQRLRQEQTGVRDRGTATLGAARPAREARRARLRQPRRSATSRASGADPKDKIEEYKTLNTLMREGLVGLREGRYAASLARFQGLLRRGIDSFEVHYYAARALAGLKRWREAAAHYEGAIEKLPTYSAAYLGLADAHLADGKAEPGTRAVRRGQKARQTIRGSSNARATSRAVVRDAGAGRCVPTSAWRRWRRAMRSCGSSSASCTAIWAAGGRRAPAARGHRSSIRRRPRTGTRSG